MKTPVLNLCDNSKTLKLNKSDMIHKKSKNYISTHSNVKICKRKKNI